MEEERTTAAWRWQWEGVQEERPIVILSEEDDDGNDKEGEFEDGGKEAE